MESRADAERFIKYFERIASMNGNREVWQKGLSTAKEWLRLIDSKNPSQIELSTFIGVVHANRYRSSGWSDLASRAYNWVISKGLSVASPKDFFTADGLPSDSRLFELSSFEHALILNKIFRENNNEDPSSDGWAKGLEITQKWLKLIQKPEKTEAEISLLVENAFVDYRKYSAKAWFDTTLTISLWCKAIGYSHLIPDEFREIASISDTPKIK